MKKIFVGLLFLVVFFNGCSPGGGFRSISSLDLSSPEGHTSFEDDILPQKGQVPMRPRLGDRFYIANVLEEIYTTGSAPSDATVVTHIKNTILANGHFFGGIAHDYDPPEFRSIASVDYHQSPSFANVGAPGSALLISICTTLNETVGVLGVIETKTGLTGKLSPSAIDFAPLYKLFYPTKDSNYMAHVALETLFNKVKMTSNRNDAIKVVLYTLCTSPDWTVL
jgi:hypothetical protein